jgi:lysophospholipase L1-like esterase
MNTPYPTRLSLLALACISAAPSCQHDGPPSAARATSAPAAPEGVAIGSRSAAPASPPAILAASVASAIPTAVASAPATPSARPMTSVLVLGDSLTDEKVGGGGFVKILRARCSKVTFENRAKGGFMVNQIRKRLETEVLPEAKTYSHAVVFGGVNDLYSDQTANRTLARIEADLTLIYGDLKARSIDVIAVTVTPWGDFKRWFTPERGQNTLTLNRWIQAQPAAGTIHAAVDAYPLLSCGDPERLCPALAAPHKDGLHFGKLGHEKLAQALLAGPFQNCPH